MTATILALVTDAFGGRGGIAQYNRDFLSALASAGYRVALLPRHAPDHVAPPPGIKQHPARSGRIAYSLAALQIACRVRPRVVFCGHLYMAPLAWLAARLADAELVIQVHGIEAWQRPSALVRWTSERASLILSVSRYTRMRVLDWAAITPERVVILPNTVADFFVPGDGSALRQELGLNDKRVLLTVGRMNTRERYKGHDRVIGCLRDLVERGFDIAYVIVGEGDDRTRLAMLAKKAGVAERVMFLGPVGRDRLREAYRMADVFVMPSTGEGFGIAFLEAMACGTPAVGLANGGSSDALGDGSLGDTVTEGQLSERLALHLASRGSTADVLSAAVATRFGRPAFIGRARALVRPLAV